MFVTSASRPALTASSFPLLLPRDQIFDKHVWKDRKEPTLLLTYLQLFCVSTLFHFNITVALNSLGTHLILSPKTRLCFSLPCSS